MVSWRPVAKAILSLVPTPSTLDTRTGSVKREMSSLKNAPNKPISWSTSGEKVERTIGAILLLRELAASMSTPACL